MLLVAAILALIISNGSYSDSIFNFKKIWTLGTENFGLKLSVLHWINDVLIAIFSFCLTRN